MRRRDRRVRARDGAGRRGGVTLRESLVMVVVAALFVALVTYDGGSGRPGMVENLRLKNCLEHMKAIHAAAQLAVMENPDAESVTLALLVEKKLIPRVPLCPNVAPDRPQDGEYRIIDKPGVPIDVECVNHRDPRLGHGSFLQLKSKYLDRPDEPAAP